MASFPIWWTRSKAGAVAAILCLALFSLLPHPGLAHPSSESRIDDLNRRIAADPENAILFLQRGEIHRELRLWAKAESDYAESRRLDPDLAAVDYSLARLRHAAGRGSEALALLDRYLENEPDDGAALALRATLRSEMGEHLAAAEDYRLAIAAWRSGGDLPPPHLYLGRAAAQVAAGDDFVADALQGLGEGLTLLGSPITLELEALELELRLGRFDEALQRIDRHLDREGRPGPWLMRRGLALESAGRFEEAHFAYEGAYADFDSRPGGRRDTQAVTRQLESIRESLARVEARLQAAEVRGDD